MIQSHLLSFYGWWQFVVCLFGCIALLGIWWHIGRKQQDVGQVWLALSILCWSFSGATEVYFSQTDMTASSANLLAGWRSIFSLFNSLFILLALPWFRYIPHRIEHIVKSRYWIYIIGLPFLFSLIPTIRKMITGRGIGVISELDVYYAILTLGFLGIVLWNSFAKRRLQILAWLTVVFVIFTLIAQVYKLTGSEIDMMLFSAIFKTSLIMIFFALALSWVKELTETMSPIVNQMQLRLSITKTENGKPIREVHLTGLPGIHDQSIKLTPALFELLMKFAERKKEAGGGWLEIKPKSISKAGTNFDIKDHNEIKRLVESMLDGIYKKRNWSKNLHYLPLKEALFEMSEEKERHIRLRIDAANIQTQ